MIWTFIKLIVTVFNRSNILWTLTSRLFPSVIHKMVVSAGKVPPASKSSFHTCLPNNQDKHACEGLWTGETIWEPSVFVSKTSYWSNTEFWHEDTAKKKAFKSHTVPVLLYVRNNLRHCRRLVRMLYEGRKLC